MAAFDGSAVLTVLVPGDPDQNTGGYRYVGRVVSALNDSGHRARVVGVDGRFPCPDDTALAAVDEQLAQMADGAVVILDGLTMGGMPEVIERHAERLNLVALVHHPLADETGLEPDQQALFFRSEQRALAAVRGVVATSDYTAARLADFGVPAKRVRVARPGVDALPTDHSGAASDTDGDSATVELLCVAHLSPRKAQLQLVEALAGLARSPWHCTLIGSDQRHAEYAARVTEAVVSLGLQSRITVAGELDSREVEQAYRCADLFVFPSLYEGYGMAIDEALAAGLPVVTSDGGALSRVTGTPGVRTYPADDTDALTGLLSELLGQPERLVALRRDLESASTSVQTWEHTAEAFVQALAELTGERDATLFDATWLALREPADHRARDRALTEQLAGWMTRRYQADQDRAPIAIADLGSGGGSNARYLSPRIGVPQHWTLLDQDAELMGIAEARLASLDVPLKPVIADLMPETLAQYLPMDAEVISASALIDLVSRDWLEALAAAAAERNATVFVVLSYDGHFSLVPEHPDDGLIRQLVNEHQHGNKGAGAALGPGATAVLQQLLEVHGYRVSTGYSPWQLEGSDAELQLALMDGWCAAATEQAPAMAERIRGWLNDRRHQAERGELAVQVGHQDLLAFPSGASGG
ncbi:glycosyltransferase [Marinobacter goseongensis]|uniref:glycosyltransferase n=1 Tax=Marinobacter goseongensis TaxID=453838 RepID=UPI0020031521|nr:glycosyltransferase [Marinobacter goseongensis]MCK7549996.1 glycosyltransferase [Marinobacter goseongensis]